MNSKLQQLENILWESATAVHQPNQDLLKRKHKSGNIPQFDPFYDDASLSKALILLY